MCGRFTLKTPPDQWGQVLLPPEDRNHLLSDWKPRYNIAPSQDILAVVRVPAAELDYAWLRWGLIPPWADDPSIGNRMINARSETVLEKRSFIGPMKSRRCLILADGYYEWKKTAVGKQPYWIAPREGGAIQFAGLWEINRKLGPAPVCSCTIITTTATPELAELHDRMPVLLRDEAAERWMDHRLAPAAAQTLLRPAPSGWLAARPVTKKVNNARYDTPDCLSPPEQP
ncbi:MAG: DUF159 family protein [Pirellulaceae bacterium]|nr:MAG: DUF159 family protein [Pirellulaceae bacterium]